MTAATRNFVLVAVPPGSTRLAHSDASAFFPYPWALGFYDGPIGTGGLTAAKGFEVAATAPPGPFAALPGHTLTLEPVAGAGSHKIPPM